MTKSEFIDGLSRSLVGKIDENEYRKEMDYYSRYIDDEIASGKSEAEVIHELGDPRIIAKTIVQTYSMKDDPIRNEYRNESRSYHSEGSSNYENDGEENMYDKYAGKTQRILYIIAAILLLLLVCSVVFKIIAFLAPVIVVLVMVIIIIRMFNK